MRVVTVVGARPQFIKAAPVARALAGRDGIESVLVHTGQHFDDDMSEVFFRELGIPSPEYNLDINSGSHGTMTGRMIESLESVFEETDADWVLVFGDTNSTAAAAIAVAKMPIRLAHVEAGLRSFNRLMLEEVNRVLTDHVSDLCLAPTEAAMANLASEAIANRAVLTGDATFGTARILTGRGMESPPILEGVNLEEYVLCGALIAVIAVSTDEPLSAEVVPYGTGPAADLVLDAIVDASS